MTPADVEAVARRVVELLRDEGLAVASGPRLIDAAGVAERFGVSADWVRENAARLGAIRLGDGPRPRLRFDPGKVAEALTARPESVGSPAAEGRSRTGVAPRPKRLAAPPAPGQLPRRSVEVGALPERTPRRRANAPGPTPGDAPDAPR